MTKAIVPSARRAAAPTAEELHLELANSYVDDKFGCDPFSAADQCRSVESAHADQAVIDTTTRDVRTSLRVVTQDMDPSGDGLAASLVVSSPSTDLDTAVLKIKGINEPIAILGSADTAQPALTMAVIGYPASSEDGPSGPTMVPTTTRGHVTELLPPDVSSPNAGAANLVQVDAHVEQGNSGGPAVDSTGAVIGIVSFGNLRNVNYMISIADVRSVVAKTRARNQLSSIDNLWHAGLDATARGDTKQAATDFKQCSSLNPMQVYCTARAAGRLASGEPGAGAAPEPLGQSSPVHARPTINGSAVQRLALGVAVVVAAGVALTHRRARRRDARDKSSTLG